MLVLRLVVLDAPRGATGEDGADTPPLMVQIYNIKGALSRVLVKFFTFFVYVWANERTNGRTGERANERTNERTNRRTGERTNERTGRSLVRAFGCSGRQRGEGGVARDGLGRERFGRAIDWGARGWWRAIDWGARGLGARLTGAREVGGAQLTGKG